MYREIRRTENYNDCRWLFVSVRLNSRRNHLHSFRIFLNFFSMMEAQIGPSLRNARLQPRMPRWIHSAQIVMTIGSGNQRTDFAVGSIEVG